MNDYIKREDAIKYFQGMLDHDGSDYDIGVGGCIAAVKRRIPPADVAPVRSGHWIKITPSGIYECSKCGKNVMTCDIEEYKYCHRCGARMDGDNIAFI